MSNIFRFDIFHLNKILEGHLKSSYLILEGILEGSGIFIAGLLGLFLLKKQRIVSISFFGTSVFKSLLMAFIPTILLIVIGVQNKYGINAYISLQSIGKQYLDNSENERKNPEQIFVSARTQKSTKNEEERGS